MGGQVVPWMKDPPLGVLIMILRAPSQGKSVSFDCNLGVLEDLTQTKPMNEPETAVPEKWLKYAEVRPGCGGSSWAF